MEILSSTVALVVYLMMFGGPLAFAYALNFYKGSLSKENVMKRFGTMYEGLRESHESRIWYIPMMMLRVVFLVIACVFYRDQSVL